MSCPLLLTKCILLGDECCPSAQGVVQSLDVCASGLRPTAGILCREFLGKLAEVVGANMAELGSQRAASAADGTGKAAVYELEKKLAELEAGTVVEPYTGEDLKEILKAAEVHCMPLCFTQKPCMCAHMEVHLLHVGHHLSTITHSISWHLGIHESHFPRSSSKS